MANRNPGNGQPQQVIIVKQQSNGCLLTAIMFLLFGWIGLVAMAAWKLLAWTWRASVALLRWTWQVSVTPLRWTWQASVASVRWAWRWSARGSAWLTARYGWRGWAVVGAVVIVLAILGAITGNGH